MMLAMCGAIKSKRACMRLSKASQTSFLNSSSGSEASSLSAGSSSSSLVTRICGMLCTMNLFKHRSADRRYLAVGCAMNAMSRGTRSFSGHPSSSESIFSCESSQIMSSALNAPSSSSAGLSPFSRDASSGRIAGQSFRSV